MKAKKKNLVSGILHTSPRGFGFVNPLKGEEIFIPANAKKGAIDGDLVEVEIVDTSSPKGPEGKIVNVLERGRSTLAGVVEAKGKKNCYFLHCPLLPNQKIVVSSSKKLEKGNRIIAKISSYDKEIKGRFLKSIGDISDASSDFEAIVAEFQLKTVFSKEALEEAKTYSDKIKKEEKRKDLSKLCTITIDPETAKDFDDALSLEIDQKGHYHLGVHIADVAFFVKNGSYLDKEAFVRANSTYFPGNFVLPMLPFELSNNLCSLKPNEIRRTSSLLMEFSPKGELIDYSIHRAFIKSHKRLTYEEASTILKNESNHELYGLLNRLATLATLLKKARLQRGSVEFSLPEIVLKVDESGEPQEIVVKEYDISHQMVEEFMLKANEIVAIHLNKKEKMAIYRIHEEPDIADLEDFYSFVRNSGHALPKEPAKQEIQKLFEELRDDPFGKTLFVHFIKSMKLATYSQENMGHYGLALTHYCHFTSPIRRYSDLVVQRLLFDEEEKDLDLEKIAHHCSSQERVSLRAESAMLLLKKLRYLKKKFSPKTLFKAVITKIKPYGIYFNLEGFYIEGFLHISEIGSDYYIFQEEPAMLRGDRFGKTFKIRDTIELHVKAVDLIHSEVSYSSIKNKL